jgi:hypothetical protein
MTRYDGTEAVDTEPSGMGVDIEANHQYQSLPREENDYEADEATTLLQNAFSPAEVVTPSKSFRRFVLGMCVLFLFIIEASQYILTPAMEQIMEDIICRHYHPDHVLAVPGAHDNRCKETDVQKRLAMVRSWSMSLEMMFRKWP